MARLDSSPQDDGRGSDSGSNYNSASNFPGEARNFRRRCVAGGLLLVLPFLASAASAEQPGPPKPQRFVVSDDASAGEKLSWKASALPVAFAAAADIATTEWALASGRADEGNPFMRGGPGGRAALKLATAGTVIAGVRHLDRHGHQRAARVCLWSYVGVNLGVAWHNARLARGR